MPKKPTVGEISPNWHTYSRCERCGQVDDHPKHLVVVGVGEDPFTGEPIYHPHDTDKDGTVRYHHDCEHDWQHLADPRTVAAAQAGTRGDALRDLIVSNHGESA